MSSQRDSSDVYYSQTESTTVNHTETQHSANSDSVPMKYDTTNAVNKGTETFQEEKPAKLLFFNYHEYMISNYTKLGAETSDIHDQKLVITHFPNYAAPKDSDLSQSTRIVRIPRAFTIKGIIYPEFSTTLPGYEAAAISDDSEDSDLRQFVPRGIYQGQLFGTSSISPLSCYFEEQEFSELMKSINDNVKKSYSSYHILNIVEFLLDMLTFWLLSSVIKFQSKRVSFQLLDW